LLLEIELCPMRYRIVIIALVFGACGGSLSDEQRQKMREQMELREIRRVTDAEITEAAFSRGRELIKTIEEMEGDSNRIASFIKAENGRIKWIEPGTSSALALEQQLIDAYIAAETGSLQDNVQKIRNTEGDSDSILYTKPVVTKLPDGADKLEGIWNIWLSRKQLILSMDKN
jgi:hypothetical protein